MDASAADPGTDCWTLRGQQQKQSQTSKSDRCDFSLSLTLPLPLVDDRQTPEQEKSAQLQSLCGLTGLQVGDTRPVGLNEQRLFNLTYFVSLPFVQTHNRHRYSVSSLRFHCELPTQCHCITFLPHYFLLQPSKMYSGTCFPRRMCETLLTKTLKETKKTTTDKPQSLRKIISETEDDSNESAEEVAPLLPN